MPVNSTHPQYDTHKEHWEKLRDCIAGEEKIKEKGPQYLPLMEGLQENDPLYKSYLQRAQFYAATQRTVQGLVGAVLRKPYKTEFPDEEFLNNVGRNGAPLEVEVKKSLDEAVGISRYGLLVDATSEDNADPFVVSYYAEDIINWRETTINGRDVPMLIVLHETKDVVDPDDGYKTIRRDQYRQLTLERTDQEGTLAYHQEVFVRQVDRDGKESFLSLGKTQPTMKGGRPLEEIPFVVMGGQTLELEPDDELLLPMANVNISHYVNSADLEHGLHFCACPTPWATGFDPKQTAYIGSSKLLIAERPEASFGMLEFTGAGLGAIENRMDKKEHFMAVLGARLLEEQKKDAETSETLRIRQAGETSALSTVAKTVSAGWTKILQLLALWRSGAADVASISLELNRDFGVGGLDAAAITALMQGVMQGVFSWASFFYNAKKSELYPDDWTEEDEAESIKAGPPGGLAVMPLTGAPTAPGNEVIQSGETEGHTHTFRKGDPQTSTEKGHSHAINGDGTLADAHGHTHAVVDDGQDESE